MSRFIRDPDAHTRGVNAVAAVDNVGSRLRRIEQIKAARMHIRDRQLAGFAETAFNPMRQMQALGMVAMDNRATSRLTASQRNADGGGNPLTDFGRPRPSGGAGGGTAPISGRYPGMLTTANPKGTVSSAPTVFRPGGTWRPGGSLPQPGTNPTRPDLTAPNPLPAPTSFPFPGSSGGGTSSGSSGSSSGTSKGGGGGGGGGFSVMPETDQSMVDDLVSSPTIETATPSGKKFNWLLIGGLAVGAYLLMRKKG